MTRGTKLPAFAGESQEVFMTTFLTPDPGKSHVEISAAQVFKNYGHDVCPPEAQAGCIHAVPYPSKFFEMIFDTLIICACLRVTQLINIILKKGPLDWEWLCCLPW